MGHPKSGNTWLAYMLAVLLAERPETVTLYNVGDTVPFVHGRDREIEAYAHLSDPRVFRNEYPQHRRLYPRELYIVRDPRAVLVSFWHMYRTMFDDDDLTLDAFVGDYLAGRGPFTYWNKHLVRWDRQVLSALEDRERGRNLTVIQYERLVEDRGSELARAVRAAGIEPGADRLALAVARGDFSSMRSDEDRHGAEAYAGRARREGRFVRKGRVDGWKDEMSDGTTARIGEAFGSAMDALGYR